MVWNVRMAGKAVSGGPAGLSAAVPVARGSSRLGLNNGSVPRDLPLVEQGTSIPKIIHQTYPTTILPDAFHQNRLALMQANPDWECRLYDDAHIERFIEDAYGPAILGYYRRINPKYGSARADLFRYLLMYRLGGVYLDIKSTFTRPIADILRPDDTYWLATWMNKAGETHENYGIWKDLQDLPNGEFQQWHIAAAAGHPFLRAVIEAVLTNIDRYHPCLHGVGRSGVIRVTGPVAYTRAIHPLLDRHSHRLVRGEGELGLAYSVLGQLAHTGYFKTHYLQLTETVVELEGAKLSIANLYKFGLDTRTRARRTAKAILSTPVFGKALYPLVRS